jgi:Mu-like prophage major head subunit gpT
MRKTLLQHYHTLKESGSTSDFPNILGNLMYRSLIDWAKNVPDAWRTYAALGDLTDFRPATRTIGYEAEDLLPVDENGNYVDSALGDAAYQLRLATYGRGFSITRKVIINDDLGYIRKQPQRWGRSAGRSIATFVAQTVLEGNGNAFDGTALFHTNHSNLDTGGGSALSATNLQKAIYSLQDQTVLNGFQSTDPQWLLVPPALQFTAKQILNSAIVVLAGTAGAVTERGNANVLAGALGIAIDPFLSSATGYYVMADPADVPILDIAFLNGKQTPDLMVERPTFMNLAGGDDPYEYEYDVLKYKVRFDYGGVVALWWGAYKFAGA